MTSTCDGCEGHLIDDATVEVLVELAEGLSRRRMCDECRRVLCTCDMCSSGEFYSGGINYNDKYECRREPTSWLVRGENWCIVDFVQRRPYTEDELKARLGYDE